MGEKVSIIANLAFYDFRESGFDSFCFVKQDDTAAEWEQKIEKKQTKKKKKKKMKRKKKKKKKKEKKKKKKEMKKKKKRKRKKKKEEGRKEGRQGVSLFRGTPGASLRGP